MTEETTAPASFSELGLDDQLLSTLTKLGYSEPTPIQAEAIPIVLSGNDVLGQAATGTGKTAAFGLPLLQLIEGADRSKGPAALVLAPTRELAIQVSEAIEEYGQAAKTRVLAVYGGQPISGQLRALKRGVDVVVATPGRALDHIKRRSMRLDAIKMVVLDEADEMLDMGFAEDLEAILSETPADRQTLLFSATMPPRINNIAATHLSDPTHIRIKREAADADGANAIRQVAYMVNRHNKAAALGRILDVEAPKAALVFCRTRNDVDQLSETLNARGYRAEALHGGLGQEARDRVMGRLRNQVAELLIATDVAARGLDVDHLTHVFNHDTPTAPESYVHRIGRVGRAGRTGTAISLVDPRDRRLLNNIERVTKFKISIDKIPTVDDLRRKRSEITRASLVERLENTESHDIYKSLLDSLSEEHDMADIALAAIAMAHEATSPDADQQEIPDATSKGKRDRNNRDRNNRDRNGRSSYSSRDRGSREGGRFNKGGGRDRNSVSEGMTRLYVSAGRHAGMRPKDLVGAFAGESPVSGNDIGSIQIQDKFSLVEVPDRSADDVLKAMKGVQIRGKRINVRRERF